jgi:inorganic pyrophosphatase
MLRSVDRDRGIVDVLVETPQGSRNKYEYDKVRKAMRLDRRMPAATVFPVDYGFIPDTTSEDGEELDALVITESPTFVGCWVEARVVGVFWIEYDGHREAKIVCVPNDDPAWQTVTNIDDVPEHLRAELAHFFDTYKELEPSRSPSPGGWGDREAAMALIERA